MSSTTAPPPPDVAAVEADTRKKRREEDSSVDDHHHHHSEEKSKKIRGAANDHDDNVVPSSDYGNANNGVDNDATTSTNDDNDATEGWDLETALHQIVVTNDDASSNEKEMISSDRWITFRVGHAGDASAIASLYRKATTTNTEKPKTEDADALELRLASGMGDEDTPPALFALLVDVWRDDDETTTSVETTNCQLGGVALLTLGWAFQKRILRLEWFHVENSLQQFDLVKRRLWFRLSALALVTHCQVLIPPPGVEAQQQQKHRQEPQPAADGVAATTVTKA